MYQDIFVVGGGGGGGGCVNESLSYILRGATNICILVSEYWNFDSANTP